MKERKDLTNHIAIIQSYFSNGNKDGCGVAFLDSDNNIVVKKSCENALKFWLNNYDKLRIITNMCIFHNRFAVGSEVNNENSHPFLNEKGDMALVHNGVLFNYSKVKKFLIKKGHKFSSDVDSEILLHSFEEWGYNFIKELRKFGVSGSATILIMKKDEILAYTNNNSLCIFKLNDGFYGLSENLFDDKNKIKVDGCYLYVFRDAKLVKKIYVGDFYESRGSKTWYSYLFSKDYFDYGLRKFKYV